MWELQAALASRAVGASHLALTTTVPAAEVGPENGHASARMACLRHACTGLTRLVPLQRCGQLERTLTSGLRDTVSEVVVIAHPALTTRLIGVDVDATTRFHRVQRSATTLVLHNALT